MAQSSLFSVGTLTPLLFVDDRGQYVVAPVGAAAPGAGAGAGAGAAGGAGAAAMPVGYAPKNMDAVRTFFSVDTDKSGSVTANELKTALEADFRGNSFNIGLCRLLVRTFDTDHSDSIEMPEFENLYNKLVVWKRYYLGEGAQLGGGTGEAAGGMAEDFAGARAGAGAGAGAGAVAVPALMTLRGVHFTLINGRCGPGALPPKVVSLVLQSVESDPAGRVSYPEFVRLMCTLEGLSRLISTFDAKATGAVHLTHLDLIMAAFFVRA